MVVSSVSCAMEAVTYLSRDDQNRIRCLCKLLGEDIGEPAASGDGDSHHCGLACSILHDDQDKIVTERQRVSVFIYRLLGEADGLSSGL